jgi:hypothetical protein
MTAPLESGVLGVSAWDYGSTNGYGRMFRPEAAVRLSQEIYVLAGRRGDQVVPAASVSRLRARSEAGHLVARAQVADDDSEAALRSLSDRLDKIVAMLGTAAAPRITSATGRGPYVEHRWNLPILGLKHPLVIYLTGRADLLPSEHLEDARADWDQAMERREVADRALEEEMDRAEHLADRVSLALTDLGLERTDVETTRWHGKVRLSLHPTAVQALLEALPVQVRTAPAADPGDAGE